MAVPFPEAQIEPIIYMALGSLMTAVVLLGLYIRRLHSNLKAGEERKEQHIEVDKIGLSARAQELLEEVMKEPQLQSDLPSKLEVSKATVSNAVSELRERNFIRRRKKANTYLIEPKKDRIENARG